MTADLHAIRARCEAATPGPWEVEECWRFGNWGEGDPPPAYWLDGPDWGLGPANSLASEADAAFIAHAREDIPALLAALDDRDAEIARLRDELKNMTDIAWRLEHDGPRYYEYKRAPTGDYQKCMYCGELQFGGVQHTPKCPVRRLWEATDAAARRALEDEG